MSRVKDVRLYVIFKMQPARGEPTHKKDWKKTGKWRVIECPIITDSEKHWMVNSSDYIINLTQQRVDKNRTQEKKNEDVFIHYVDRYSKEIAQFCAQFRPDILDELLKALPSKEEPKQEEMKPEVETSEPSDMILVAPDLGKTTDPAHIITNNDHNLS